MPPIRTQHVREPNDRLIFVQVDVLSCFQPYLSSTSNHSIYVSMKVFKVIHMKMDYTRCAVVLTFIASIVIHYFKDSC